MNEDNLVSDTVTILDGEWERKCVDINKAMFSHHANSTNQLVEIVQERILEDCGRVEVE